MTFSRYRLGLRGLPDTVTLSKTEVLEMTTLMALTRLQSALVQAEINRSRFLLSWDSSDTPLLTYVAASTPKTYQGRFLRPDSATCQTCSARVVSHHLDGLLRMQSCGFVAPHNQLRVRLVSRCRPPFQSRKREPSWAVDRHSPRRGSYPPKNFPHRQPYRIAAAVTLMLLCVK